MSHILHQKKRKQSGSGYPPPFFLHKNLKYSFGNLTSMKLSSSFKASSDTGEPALIISVIMSVYLQDLIPEVATPPVWRPGSCKSKGINSNNSDNPNTDQENNKEQTTSSDLVINEKNTKADNERDNSKQKKSDLDPN